MPYALDREKKAVSPLYPTQDEIVGFVRAIGFCSEVQEREMSRLRRVNRTGISTSSNVDRRRAGG